MSLKRVVVLLSSLRLEAVKRSVAPFARVYVPSGVNDIHSAADVVTQAYFQLEIWPRYFAAAVAVCCGEVTY